jgi:hypothetical protein
VKEVDAGFKFIKDSGFVLVAEQLAKVGHNHRVPNHPEQVAIHG